MIFIAPVLIGFIFEILASPHFGFYFLPALLMVSVFYALPFVFPWLNILIAYTTSFLFSYVWTALISGNHLQSSSYAVHMLMYLTVVAFPIIIVHFLQKK